MTVLLMSGRSFQLILWYFVIDVICHPSGSYATEGKKIIINISTLILVLQCFDAVGWAAGRASGL